MVNSFQFHWHLCLHCRPYKFPSTTIYLSLTYFAHRSDLFSSPDGEEKRTRTPFQRSVGVQTDYRESETQTDPYTPDYVLRPGTAPPELLTLATLTWGKQHKPNKVLLAMFSAIFFLSTLNKKLLCGMTQSEHISCLLYCYAVCLTDLQFIYGSTSARGDGWGMNN